MIYLFIGKSPKIGDKYVKLIAQLSAKRPDASVFRVDDQTYEQGQFNEYVFGQTLFFNKFIVATSYLSDNTEAVLYLTENIDQMAESENIFIVLEREVKDKTLEKKLRKLAAKVEEDKVGEEKSKEFFSPFVIGDAVGRRDRAELWRTLEIARRRGVTAEDAFWKIVGSVKNMLITKKVKDPEDYGLKGFPLTKAKQAAGHYSVLELEKLSAELVDIYYLCRDGEGDFDIELQKLAFTL